MKWADRLWKLLPPLDVTDPEIFMTEAISILTMYPEAVMERAVHEIPRRTDRPTLRLIKSVCDEVFAPVERQWERDAAHRSHIAGALPRPARTPEQQARIDAQIARAKAEIAAAQLNPTTRTEG